MAALREMDKMGYAIVYIALWRSLRQRKQALSNDGGEQRLAAQLVQDATQRH